MSCAFVAVAMLLSSSMVVAFVLQPSREEVANVPVSNPRCHREWLEAVRKRLLSALSLQLEPQLAGLDVVPQPWRSTFTTADAAAAPALSGSYVSPDVGSAPGPKCCSWASEVSMKDLGWDTWVIHPASLTIVECAACDARGDTGECPSPLTNIQDAQTQVQGPCCQPVSEAPVPVVYVDESRTVVITSIQLTRACGCGLGRPRPPPPSQQSKFVY